MLAKHEQSELHGLMSHHGSGDGAGLLATIDQKTIFRPKPALWQGCAVVVHLVPVHLRSLEKSDWLLQQYILRPKAEQVSTFFCHGCSGFAFLFACLKHQLQHSQSDKGWNKFKMNSNKTAALYLV